MAKNDNMKKSNMDRYAEDWRRHYQTSYGTMGHPYDYYEPAYQYGMSLRNEARYRDWDWGRLEPEAQRTWTERYPRTAWDDIKDAVRHAWENVKAAVGD